MTTMTTTATPSLLSLFFSRRGALIAALMLMLTALSACEGDLSLSIDRERVQQRVASEFPQTHDIKGIASLTLSDPVVDLAVGGDRIGLTTTLALKPLNLPLALNGEAKTSGALRYEPADATFYMADIRIEDLDIPMKFVSEDQKQRLLDLTNAALQGSLKDIGVYTLETRASREAANRLLKSLTVQNNKLEIVLGLGS